MKISNRVKRDISFTLMLVGIVSCIARLWYVVMTPSSGKAWFELIGMAILTYPCLDDYLTYRRRVKDGIMFGSKR